MQTKFILVRVAGTELLACPHIPAGAGGSDGRAHFSCSGNPGEFCSPSFSREGYSLLGSPWSDEVKAVLSGQNLWPLKANNRQDSLQPGGVSLRQL